MTREEAGFGNERGSVMKQEFCLTCNRAITPVLSVRKETVNFKGEVFEIDANVASCPTCGDEFLTRESHDVNLQQLQDAYCIRHDDIERCLGKDH